MVSLFALENNAQTESGFFVPPTTKDTREAIIRSNQEQIARGEIKESEQIFIMTQVVPEPPGGIANFRKWIAENYQYPQEAINAGVKGRVELIFVVERDGSLTNMQIERDLGYGTGQAGIDLFKKSPKWGPGIQNGKPVRVVYTFPIRMDLSQ